MALYLQLPATKGQIAAVVKERILDRMFKHGEGFLTASARCGISAARAFGELRADEQFRKCVDDARVVIVEKLSEEYIAISDLPATSRHEVAARALRLKAREFVMTKILRRFRPAAAPAQMVHQTLVTGNQITMPAAEQAKLAEARAQYDRLYAHENKTSGEVIDAETVTIRDNYTVTAPAPVAAPATAADASFVPDYSPRAG